MLLGSQPVGNRNKPANNWCRKMLENDFLSLSPLGSLSHVIQLFRAEEPEGLSGQGFWSVNLLSVSIYGWQRRGTSPQFLNMCWRNSPFSPLGYCLAWDSRGKLGRAVMFHLYLRKNESQDTSPNSRRLPLAQNQIQSPTASSDFIKLKKRTTLP